MEELEGMSADPAFAQTVRSRLDAIARMGGGSPLRAASAPPNSAESDGERVSMLDELTRARLPSAE